MVQDFVLVTAFHSSQFFISIAHWREQVMQGSLAEWKGLLLSNRLGFERALAIETAHFRKLNFVKHLYIHFAAPDTLQSLVFGSFPCIGRLKLSRYPF
jgi:hypothetical protein